MAIQEVEKRDVVGTQGITRRINKAAEGMIMDIVQAQQYTKPIPSTVRELTANAVDAQSEKEKAIEILSGQADSDKYFIKREGDLYKDSNWDPSYYDLNYLNKTDNDIVLIYKEREGVGRCDSFIVKDYGVGIGKRRLQGLFEVGYSTKRNRKDALGAFGLGAKVGLATGADYYKVTTVYNGIKYMFQVFNKKLNSLIGPVNIDTGKNNIAYVFESGETIYGEETTEKNFTEVEVPCLKHHKQDYTIAVKTQLLYFPNVRFFIEDIYGDKTEINFKPDILYDSENLIISDSSPYSKPHVVIVKPSNGDGPNLGVCYGHIDFKEMELQDMSGNIGIKCPIRSVYEDEKTGEEIEISPGVDVIASREAIRWTANTRDYLTTQFKKAQEEATGLVEEELKEKDFLKWLQACRNILSYAGGATPIGRLSKIVDLNTLRPKYTVDRSVVYGTVSEIFEGFTIRSVTKFYDNKAKKFELNRDEVSTWHSVNLDSIYYMEDKSKRNTDLYLCDQHGGTFTTIKPKSDQAIETEVNDLLVSNKIKKKDVDSIIQKRIAYRDRLIGHLSKSENFKEYDEIEVPEDYWKQLEKTEEGQSEEVPLTNEERRKLEQKVVANAMELRYAPFYSREGQTFKRYQHEPKFQEVKDYEGNLYFGQVVDEEKLHLACHILYAQMYRKRENDAQMYESDMFYNDEYKIVLVSKSNVKHFINHRHIDDFFGYVEQNGKGVKVMVDNALIKWNTARHLHSMLQGLDFFTNYDSFDEEKSKLYRELCTYVSNNFDPLDKYRDRFGMKDKYDDLLKFLNSLESLQVFLEEDPSEKEIANKVKDLAFPHLPENTNSCLVIDREKIKEAEKLLEYANPVKALFNYIPLLTEEKDVEIPLETAMLIEEVVKMKGL